MSRRAAPCGSIPWSHCGMNSSLQTARNSSSEQSWANIWRFGDILGGSSRVTLEIYGRRAFRKKVCTGAVLRRAFDKAVRRKPPVVAADAGLMQIQLWEDSVSRCAEAVRQSTTDDSGS